MAGEQGESVAGRGESQAGELGESVAGRGESVAGRGESQAGELGADSTQERAAKTRALFVNLQRLSGFRAAQQTPIEQRPAATAKVQGSLKPASNPSKAPTTTRLMQWRVSFLLT